MIRLDPNISEQDRKEVERRLKALDKPERKKPANQGFNHKECYGLSLFPCGSYHHPIYMPVYGKTYAERQKILYNLCEKGN